MLDSYQDLIEELTETPNVLRGLLAGQATAVPPATVALIAELRDRDQAVRARLQTMLRQRDPLLRPLALAGPMDVETDLDAVVAGFNAARGELISLLMNLTLRDWERTALLTEGGETRMADEVEQHVDYDETHLDRLRAALGG